MNRIQQYWSNSSETSGQAAVEVEFGRIQNAAEPADHSLFVPLHYERNYAYPLIVWLHGAGDDERQLKRIMPFVSMRNYVAVAPRGTHSSKNQTGYGWSQTQDHITQAEQRVLEAMAAAAHQVNIAKHRIFLAGFGAGGTMAFRLALNMPDVFAGALSLGGPFPTGLMPLAQLHRIRQLRFLLASGRDSRRYPPHKVCENLRLIYSAGMSINLRQYPCGDDLTTHMLADMDRWIMEQFTSQTPASADQPQPRAGGNVD